MTQFDFDFNLALSLYESTEEFPVNFDDAWPWLDFSTKGNAKRNFEKCGFIDGTDFYSFIRTNKRAVGATQVEVIKMTVECFKMWAMMVETGDILPTPKSKIYGVGFLKTKAFKRF